MGGSGRIGNTKVTRAEWLAAAKDILVREGEEAVKILPLAETLSVSRSSFYWYFRDRRQLLEDLLSSWDAGNTGVITSHCAMPSTTIAEAVLNLFRCFVGDGGFDHRLDFAVREWARRSPEVRGVIGRADDTRLHAIAAMYAWHGFEPADADIRARILYYQQIGYYALELHEPLGVRLARVSGYVAGFTGQRPTVAELDSFLADVSPKGTPA